MITEYEVDVSTLPQFDRQKVTQVDLPSGDQQTILRFRRPDVQFLKLDPLAPGPDVLVERQTANLRIVTSAAGETLDINGHITIRRMQLAMDISLIATARRCGAQMLMDRSS